MAANDDVARFGVDVDATGAQQGADAAADALERLDAEIVEGTQSLAAMQRALRNLKGGGAVNIQQFKELKQRIEAKKVTIAQTQAKYIELGGTFKKTKKPTDDAAGSIEGLLSRIQGAGGPLGRMSGRLSALKPLLAAGPYIALAAAVVGVTTAFVALTVAVTAFGIAAANAHRDEKLMLEGLVKMPSWFRRTADSAAFLQWQISKVAANNPLARAELGSLADELYTAGLRGDGFARALEGVAVAQAGGGAKAAAFYKSLVIGAGRSTAAIKKFSDDAKARFGNIVAAKMLSLDVQSKKLKENFDQLFSGLRIEGLLKALSSVTELFSQNTSTGKALKVVIEGLLQPIIDAVARTGPIAKRFFQGLVLGALELTIAILRVRLWLKKTFGGSDITPNIDKMRVAVALGAAAFGFLATAAILSGVAILGAMTLAALPFIALAAVIALPGIALYKLIGVVHDLKKQLEAQSWFEPGKALVMGFVNGILFGIPQVVGAVTKLGGAAIQALKAKLESRSPSKAFERDAATAPQGVVVAFRKGRPKVAAAAGEMGQAARIGFQKAAPNGSEAPALRAGASGGGTSPAAGAQPQAFHWSGNLIYQSKGDSPKQEAAELRDLLLHELTGVGIAIGANLKESA